MNAAHLVDLFSERTSKILIDAYHVSSLFLRVIECHIGGGYPILGFLKFRGIARHSHTDGDSAVRKVSTLDTLTNTFGDDGRFFPACVRKQDGKFLAAISCSNVGCTKCLTKCVSDQSQNLVPGGMSEAVVVRLEMIYIYHQQAH